MNDLSRPEKEQYKYRSFADVAAAVERLTKWNSSGRAARAPSPTIFTEIREFTSRTNFFRNPYPLSKKEEDDLTVRWFEEDLWKSYGLTGAIVPDSLLKECQRRLHEAENGLVPDYEVEPMKELLGILDKIHRHRKESPSLAGQVHTKGNWMALKPVPPTEEMVSKGRRCWALIIGNNDYPNNPLRGCVNDAILVNNYMQDYLGIPADHICLLKNATREMMINGFYDLRDNERIQPGDNILIHYSGHATSYDARDYFATFTSKAGSIEGISPIDRGPTVPDISDRELNSILYELQAEKGHNITLFLDCCRSGGVSRSPIPDDGAIRHILPLPATYRKGDLSAMFEAADNNPRRRRTTPLTSSEAWVGDVSGFVQLAACHDFQFAREANTIRLGAISGMEVKELENNLCYGHFTWALVNVLKSELGRTGTYESVIESIGQLNDMQNPVVVGRRKDSRLWYT